MKIIRRMGIYSNNFIYSVYGAYDEVMSGNNLNT
jgi:hypothetical protein